MSRDSELIIESRYIHTGNSGVTISVERDVKRPTRAILKVRNGSHGAFSTEMEIRGNDYNGMCANQLRDLALIFLEGANTLDEIKEGKPGDFQYSNENSPSILPEDGVEEASRISRKLQDHLVQQYKDKGDTNAYMTVHELVQTSSKGWSGGTDKNGKLKLDKETRENMKKPRIDKVTLVMDRLKYLVNKL